MELQMNDVQSHAPTLQMMVTMMSNSDNSSSKSSLSSLSSDYLALLQGGTGAGARDRFADVAFCVGGRSDALIYAHRCILAARSPFFRLLFSTGPSLNAHLPQSVTTAAACPASMAPHHIYNCGTPDIIITPTISHSCYTNAPHTDLSPTSIHDPDPTGFLVTRSDHNTSGNGAAQFIHSVAVPSPPDSYLGIVPLDHIIPIDIVSYEAFAAVLRFIYTGQLIIDPILCTNDSVAPALNHTNRSIPSMLTTTRDVTYASYNLNQYTAASVHHSIHLCLELIHAAKFFGVEDLCTLAQAKLGSVLIANRVDGAAAPGGLVNHCSIISLEDLASVLIVARKHKMSRLWLAASELLVSECDLGGRCGGSSTNYYYYYYYYELLQKYLPHDVLSEFISTMETIKLRPSHDTLILLDQSSRGGGLTTSYSSSSSSSCCNSSSTSSNNCSNSIGNSSSSGHNHIPAHCGNNLYTGYSCDDQLHSMGVMAMNNCVMQIRNADHRMSNHNMNHQNMTNTWLAYGNGQYNRCNSSGSSTITTTATNNDSLYDVMSAYQTAAIVAETSEMLRLKQALECMDMEMVRMMAMGEGIDLNAAEALHYAVMRCSREVVKALLEMQGLVDVNHRIARRASAREAMSNFSSSCSSSCSSSSSSCNGTSSTSPAFDHTDPATAAGRAGGEETQSMNAAQKDCNGHEGGQPHSGMSALHLAAMMGSADMIAVLLDHHADPMATTDDGVTPLDILRAHIQPAPSLQQKQLYQLQPAADGTSRCAPYTNHTALHLYTKLSAAAGAGAISPGPNSSSSMSTCTALSKSEHKRILLCIELIQSAAAVAQREEHEHEVDNKLRDYQEQDEKYNENDGNGDGDDDDDDAGGGVDNGRDVEPADSSISSTLTSSSAHHGHDMNMLQQSQHDDHHHHYMEQVEHLHTINLSTPARGHHQQQTSSEFLHHDVAAAAFKTHQELMSIYQSSTYSTNHEAYYYEGGAVNPGCPATHGGIENVDLPHEHHHNHHGHRHHYHHHHQVPTLTGSS